MKHFSNDKKTPQKRWWCATTSLLFTARAPQLTLRVSYGKKHRWSVCVGNMTRKRVAFGNVDASLFESLSSPSLLKRYFSHKWRFCHHLLKLKSFQTLYFFCGTQLEMFSRVFMLLFFIYFHTFFNIQIQTAILHPVWYEFKSRKWILKAFWIVHNLDMENNFSTCLWVNHNFLLELFWCAPQLRSQMPLFFFSNFPQVHVLHERPQQAPNSVRI